MGPKSIAELAARRAEPAPPARSSLGCGGCSGAGALGLFLLMGVCYYSGNSSLERAREAAARATPAPTAPPTTLSAEEKRLGPRPRYCPGTGLKHLGLFSKAPPCIVEIYLGKSLKDPRSFEADDRCAISAGKDAWIADCTYRARNSFGAITLERHRFWIKNDRLLKVE